MEVGLPKNSDASIHRLHFGKASTWLAVCIVLALLLIWAGIGKLLLVTSPSSTSVVAAIFGMKIIWLTGSIEIFLGLALLFFSQLPALIGAVIGWFVLLSATNAFLGILGAASCECLGRSGLSPWFMLAIDVLIVLIIATTTALPFWTCVKASLRWWKEATAVVVVYLALFLGHATDAGQRLESMLSPAGIAINHPWIVEGNSSELVVETKIGIFNNSNIPLEVIGFSHSCSCELVEGLPVTIGPQATSEIRCRMRSGKPGLTVREVRLLVNAHGVREVREPVLLSLR